MRSVRERLSKAVRTIFAAVLVVGLLPAAALTTAASPGTALAAPSEYLEVGGTIRYDNYATHWMWVDGAVAICGNPSKATPPSGTYERHDDLLYGAAYRAEEWQDADRQRLKAELYYGWGSPGFDASMWPSTWYDGSAMTSERYVALLHLLISDLYNYDLNAACHGCSDGFMEWVRYNVTGYGTDGNKVAGYENTTRSKTENAMWSVPSSFHAFVLETGSRTQHILSYDLAGNIEITKQSSNGGMTDGNSCYSLEGAVYGVYSDAACANQVATLTTNADGWARAEGIEAGDYWIKEITPPPGYALDKTAHAVHVPAGDTAYCTYSDAPQNDPAAMWVGKVDLETTLDMPLGSASLAGAEYTVRYYDGYYDTVEAAEASGDPVRTWVVATNENGYADLSEDFLVSGDELYKNSAGISTIPLGTLLIQETKAPKGYILDGNTVHVSKITSVGTAESVTTFNPPVHPEQVKRGDLSLVKTREDSQTRLSGVPFLITSQTTGESHVAVTDANGELNTASDFNSHESATNANDAALKADGTVDEALLDPEAGIWFSGSADAATDPDDAKGALPYDVYTVEELPVAANEGLALVTLTVTVTRDGYEIDLGTVDDQPMTISTAARDGLDGDKTVSAEESAVVIDRVEYAGAAPGAKYRLDATLVDAATGEPAQAAGAPVTGSAEFAAAAAAGYAEVEIAFDGLALPEGSYVVYETVTELSSGRVVAAHEDAADAAQTVELVRPEIGTTATDAVSGGHEAVIDPELTVVDTVAYKGLSTAREYTVTGTLVDKATGEPALDAQGDEITAEATFTPEAASGAVEVTFTFDATALEEGTQLVAFETLTSGGREYAVHADIDDEGQTVTLTRPAVATVATDAANGTHEVSADTETELVDVVETSGLAPGKEYRLSGAVMLVSEGEDGTLSAEPLTDAEGNAVVSELTFTAQLADEQHEMAFGPFDTSSLGGRKLVVYETLYRGDKAIASHEDPADEGQTLEVVQPEIGTAAFDGLDGDKTVVADHEASIVDTVGHVGLVPGKEYRLSGALMVLGEDGSAEPALDANGEPIVAETVFTPQLPKDSVEVVFEFDSSPFAGKSLVVYETLYRGDAVVAVHEDPADEMQTVEVASPEIATSAVDAVDGDKTVAGDDGSAVVDTVSYSNVIPGRSYELHGMLVDRATGTPLVSGDFSEDELAEVTEGLADAFGVELEQQLVPGSGWAFNDDVKAVKCDYAAHGASEAVVYGTDPGVEPGQIAVLIPADGEGGSFALRVESAEQQGDDWVLRGTTPAVDEILAETDPAAIGGADLADLAEQGLETRYVVSASETPHAVDWEALAKLEKEHADVFAAMAYGAAEMTPEHPQGAVDVTMTIDSSTLGAADVVAYEVLVDSSTGEAVASHVDADDPDQQVSFAPPELATEAVDATDGDHSILPSETAEIVDTVSYSNLVPGKEYEVKGTLMDKSTGKPLIVGDEEVTSSVLFTPNESSGTVELTFEFDASGLTDGTEIVAFEHAYKDGVEIAAHADIDDEAQTVTVRTPPLDGSFGKTGFDVALIAGVLAAVAAAGAGCAAYGIRRRRANAENDGEQAA